MTVRFSWRSDAVWALLDQILVSACTFLVTLVVARLVSVEAFSAFGLSVTVTLFASSMHRAWLTQPFSVLGVRESEHELVRRFKAVIGLHIFLWPIVTVVVAVVGARYFPSRLFATSVLVYILAYLLQEAVRRFCFTTTQIRLALAMDVIAYGGYFLVLLAMFHWQQRSAELALFSGATCFVLSGAWGVARCGALNSSVPWPKYEDVIAYAAEHWQQSKWVCASQLFMFGSFMLVPFQIAELGSLVWVAHYNAANTILNVLNIMRQTMGNYLPIYAARVHHQQGFVAFERMLNRLCAAVLVVSALVVVVLIVLSGVIVRMLYGERYLPVADILPIASIGPLVAMVSFITQAGGMVLGRTEHIFYSYLVGTVLSMGAAIWLIPHFGLAGAIWVANIGYVVPTLWHWVSFRRDCRQVALAGGLE